MTTKEIITSEEGNLGEIRLHREGIFWRAYERSAYMLTTQVRQLKVLTRTVKAAGNATVAYVGFPMASYDSFAAGLEELSKSEESVVLRGRFRIDETDYQKWKNSLADHSAHNAPNGEDNSLSRNDMIAARVLAFDLANHTPMECMMLISELQRCQ